MDFRIKQPFLNSFHMIFIQEWITVYRPKCTSQSLNIWRVFFSCWSVLSPTEAHTHIQSGSYARPARERSFYSTRDHQCARDGFGPTAFKQQWPLSGYRAASNSCICRMNRVQHSNILNKTAEIFYTTICWKRVFYISSYQMIPFLFFLK